MMRADAGDPATGPDAAARAARLALVPLRDTVWEGRSFGDAGGADAGEEAAGADGIPADDFLLVDRGAVDDALLLLGQGRAADSLRHAAVASTRCLLSAGAASAPAAARSRLDAVRAVLAGTRALLYRPPPPSVQHRALAAWQRAAEASASAPAPSSLPAAAQLGTHTFAVLLDSLSELPAAAARPEPR